MEFGELYVIIRGTHKMPRSCADNWDSLPQVYWGSKDIMTIMMEHFYLLTDAQALQSAYYGSGSGLIHIDNVMCSGNESSLFDCPHSIHHNCGHIKDASVSCQTGELKKCQVNKV